MPASQPVARPFTDSPATALVAGPAPVLPSSLRRILASGDPHPRGAVWARGGWSLALVVIVGGGLVLWRLLIPAPIDGGDVFLGPPMAPARPDAVSPASTALIQGGPGQDPLRGPARALQSGGRRTVAALASLRSSPAARVTRSPGKVAGPGRPSRSGAASGADSGRRSTAAHVVRDPDRADVRRTSTRSSGSGSPPREDAEERTRLEVEAARNNAAAIKVVVKDAATDGNHAADAGLDAG